MAGATRYAMGFLVMVFGVVRDVARPTLLQHMTTNTPCPERLSAPSTNPDSARLQILPLTYAFLRKSRSSLKRAG